MFQTNRLVNPMMCSPWCRQISEVTGRTETHFFIGLVAFIGAYVRTQIRVTRCICVFLLNDFGVYLLFQILQEPFVCDCSLVAE